MSGWRAKVKPPDRLGSLCARRDPLLPDLKRLRTAGCEYRGHVAGQGRRRESDAGRQGAVRRRPRRRARLLEARDRPLPRRGRDRLARRRLLAAAELDRALLDERRDALAEVLRLRGLGLEIRLELELLPESVRARLVEEPLRQRDRTRRACRELGRALGNARLESLRFDNLGDESPRKRLGRGQAPV